MPHATGPCNPHRAPAAAAATGTHTVTSPPANKTPGAGASVPPASTSAALLVVGRGRNHHPAVALPHHKLGAVRGQRQPAAAAAAAGP